MECIVQLWVVPDKDVTTHSTFLMRPVANVLPECISKWNPLVYIFHSPHHKLVFVPLYSLHNLKYSLLKFMVLQMSSYL